MRGIRLEPEILSAAPAYCGSIIECDVRNTLFDAELWEDIEQACAQLRQAFALEQANKRSGIFEMRMLYRKLGKDPNRYRPSAEALTRRILQGKPLYRINTLVDLINLVSLHTGFSIGTPTSDEERTKLLPETQRLLMVVHSAGGDAGLDAAVAHSVQLLERYASAQNVTIGRF